MIATSEAINALYTSYLEDPESGCAALLAAILRLAKITFHDDDDAQDFTIMTWQCLPDLVGMPCTLGGWIWRQLQWRRIDNIRAHQCRLSHEIPVPRIMDHSDEPLLAEETLDLIAHNSAWHALTERVGNLGRISDPFIRRVAQDLIAGYTQDEIALRLDCNPSTLRSRLSRYRRRRWI